MKTLLVALLLTSSPAFAANAFMGHYGYMLTMPDGYFAKPSFSGPLEVADMFTAACRGMDSRMACAKVGMVELYAMPKRDVERVTGRKGLDSYLKMITGDAAKAGLEAKVTRRRVAGFPAAVVSMPGHPQPLNTMLLIEGSKVYYRFKYNDKTGAKAAAAMAATLKEVAPNDDPPPPGAR